MRVRRVCLLSAIAAILVIGCGRPAPQTTYTVVAPATITPGDQIPLPRHEVILTLSGALRHSNDSGSLRFDMETLEQIGLVSYTVQDPYLQQSITFSGVLMSDLLRVAGVPPEATLVHIVALDDYEVDIAIDDIQKWPILLATRADGKRMDVATYGPTRLLFPYGHYPIDEIAYREAWIWNVESMEIR